MNKSTKLNNIASFIVIGSFVALCAYTGIRWMDYQHDVSAYNQTVTTMRQSSCSNPPATNPTPGMAKSASNCNYHSPAPEEPKFSLF